MQQLAVSMSPTYLRKWPQVLEDGDTNKYRNTYREEGEREIGKRSCTV